MSLYNSVKTRLLIKKTNLTNSYAGDLCDIRKSPCSSNPCFKDVICNETDSKALCGPCPPGLTGNGFICKEINDCKSNPCYSGVKCTDLLAPERGFICGPCPQGQTGNGITCIGIFLIEEFFVNTS